MNSFKSICECCGKKANVHFTQIANGTIIKTDLCSECAHKKGLWGLEAFALNEKLLKEFLNLHLAEPTSELACSHCKLTLNQFLKKGRFGCIHCYTAFEHLLVAFLQNVKLFPWEFKGKFPKKLTQQLHNSQLLHQYEQSLQNAIAQERYEEAAKLRDMINALKKKN